MNEQAGTARLADLTVALSLATDLGTGQPNAARVRTRRGPELSWSNKPGGSFRTPT